MKRCGGGRRRRIVPGERVEETADGLIYGVASFLEKPALESARVCLAADSLWNTFVFLTALPTLLPLGRSLVPRVDERLARIGAFAATEHEAWAIREAYGSLPTWDSLAFHPPGMPARPGRVQAGAGRTVSAKLSGPLALFQVWFLSLRRPAPPQHPELLPVSISDGATCKRL